MIASWRNGAGVADDDRVPVKRNGRRVLAKRKGRGHRGVPGSFSGNGVAFRWEVSRVRDKYEVFRYAEKKERVSKM